MIAIGDCVMDDARDARMCRIIGRRFAKQFGGDADEWQSVAYLAVVNARPGFDPSRATWETYASAVARNALRAASLSMMGLYKSKCGIKPRIPIQSFSCPLRHHDALANLASRHHAENEADIARAAVEIVREMLSDSPEDVACLDALVEGDRRWRERHPSFVSMPRSAFDRRRAAIRSLLAEVARHLGWEQEE